MSMKNTNDTIGNRTRDLPACSAVPQPTAPPRIPEYQTRYSVIIKVVLSILEARRLCWSFYLNTAFMPAVWHLSSFTVYLFQRCMSYNNRNKHKHKSPTSFILYSNVFSAVIVFARICYVHNNWRHYINFLRQWPHCTWTFTFSGVLGCVLILVIQKETQNLQLRAWETLGPRVSVFRVPKIYLYEHIPDLTTVKLHIIWLC